MFLLSVFCSEFICLATKVWCGLSKLYTYTLYSSHICNGLMEGFVRRLSSLNYYVTQRSYLCFQLTGMRRITFRFTTDLMVIP